jgi:hypothetical protein
MGRLRCLQLGRVKDRIKSSHEMDDVIYKESRAVRGKILARSLGGGTRCTSDSWLADRMRWMNNGLP